MTDIEPKWVGMATLCRLLDTSQGTVEKWITEGRIPPHRMIGTKRMWKWSEVDERLSAGGQSLDAVAERIRNASRAEAH